MKNSVILLLGLFGFTIALAQTNSNVPVEKRVVEVQRIPTILEVWPDHSHLGDYHLRMDRGYWWCISVDMRLNFTGSIYTWSVNTTAGTYLGVQSMDDNIPTIRGAGPEGTAYYVDGVRVSTY